MQPIKPEYDTDRSYRYLVLENELSVLLVSDNTAKHAAASMDVAVGSFNDPDDLPGLAHFLEHMLFMGSQKYPAENAYEKFLQEHGGYGNAHTTDEHTCFYFDIDAEQFEHALDIFAQVFISPLMDPSTTDRELLSVHNEDKKNEKQDSWRIQQVVNENVDPKHPRFKFGGGNKTTLDVDAKKIGIVVRKRLLEFHEQYYSSNVMKLALVGPQSLDELESWTKSIFIHVPNKEISVPTCIDLGYPWKKQHLSKEIFIGSVKNVRKMRLLWPTPTYNDFYTDGSPAYVSHLLGHETSGSLFALLRRKGWVTALYAGPTGGLQEYDVFTVEMTLTQEAFLNHRYDIVKIVYDYIELLKTQGPQLSIWKEMQKINEIEFANLVKQEPSSFAPDLTENMWYYPPKDILRGPYAHDHFNPENITDLLKHLTPKNMVLLHIGKRFENITLDKVEKWYQVNYAIRSIDRKLRQSWTKFPEGIHPQLALPRPNLFIPTDLQVHPLPSSDPLQVDSRPNGEKKKIVANGTSTKKNKPPKEKHHHQTTHKDQNNNKDQTNYTKDQTNNKDQTGNKNLSVNKDQDINEDISTMKEEKNIKDGDKTKGTSSTTTQEHHQGSDIDPELLYPVPDTIMDTVECRVWHYQDPLFRSPKLSVQVALYPGLSFSAHVIVMAKIFRALVIDSLNEYIYDASIAGIETELYYGPSGICLSVEGYSQKIPAYIFTILKRIRKIKFKAERFEIQKQEVMREYGNFSVQQAHRRATEHLDTMTCFPHWGVQEKFAVCSSLTLEDMKAFKNTFLKQLRIEWLLHGNILKDQALTLVNDCQAIFKNSGPVYPSQIGIPRAVQLPESITVSYSLPSPHLSDPNSAIYVWFQVCPVTDVRGFLLLNLGIIITEERIYDILRTKEQLGYLLWTGVRTQNLSAGFRVLLQSSEHGPDHLEMKINHCLETIVKPALESLTQEEFLNQVNAMIANKTEKPTSLGNRTSRFWDAIEARTYNWKRTQTEVDILRTVTKEDVNNFWAHHIFDVTKRRKAVVKIHSKVHSTKLAKSGEINNESNNNETPHINGSGNNPAPMTVEGGIMIVLDALAFQNSRPLLPCSTHIDWSKPPVLPQPTPEMLALDPEDPTSDEEDDEDDEDDEDEDDSSTD